MKSLRGSDPDAALHYPARLSRSATSSALAGASSARQARTSALPTRWLCLSSRPVWTPRFQLGLPEAKLPLAEACILLATAPKSNSACMGIDAALADVRRGGARAASRASFRTFTPTAQASSVSRATSTRTAIPATGCVSSICPMSCAERTTMISATTRPNRPRSAIGRRSRSNGHSGRRYPHNEKAHPCGSKQWRVLRTGADFKLRCCGCGHELMGARSKFEKRTSGRCSVELGLHSPLRRRLAVHRLDKRPRRPCRAARVR